MSFPPAEWSWLAWVALVPLFWLVTLEGDRRHCYLAAFLGGLAFWVLAVSWVRLSDPSAWVGWLALAFVMSLWWVGFVAICRWAVTRAKISLIIAAPIIWVGLEYSRAYFLSGFPWYYVAHSQFRVLPVIQIADVTGSLGISFLIAVFNALVVDALTLPLFVRTPGGPRISPRQNRRLFAVTFLLGATLAYGFYRIATAQFKDGPKLALLQSNIEQSHKMSGDAALIVHEFLSLSQKAVAKDQPDLLVWPETAYPYGFITIDPAIAGRTLADQVRSISKEISVETWLEKKRDVTEHLHRWTDQLGVPMLVGSNLYDHQPERLDKFNSAILFQPAARETTIYHKMHLVPFGEFIPFVETLPWLTLLTPFRGERIPSLAFGKEARLLSLGSYRLAVSICFEDTIPQVIGRFFEPARGPDNQPDVLINLSNDGWFHDSSELDMHLAIAVFRAIEHRVPLARAVNTGLSALVDGNGEIRATLPKEVDDVLQVTVPLDNRMSLYSRWGDWLGLSCLAVTIGLGPVGWMVSRRKQLSVA
jgi:apolipoprotein N-acyltransferase